MICIFKKLLSLYGRADNQKRKLLRVVLEAFRRILITLGDPSYAADIRGNKLLLPVSHKLPVYIMDFPLYDTLPTRIANFLRARDRELVMVDVGANIGDTILACSDGSHFDQFLAIEANPEFIPYLKRNTEAIGNTLLVDAFCYSGEEEQIQVSIHSVGGTARVTEVEHGLAIIKKTLDEILAEYVAFQNFNFLKLDTDGNDFDILRGARKSISTSQPIILMEFDVFENVGYVDDALSAFSFLEKAGYSTVIVYDNFGNYFCTFSVANPLSFLDAIAYQITSEFLYYDLLFLCERDAGLIQAEQEFFALYAGRKGLAVTMRKALCMKQML